MQRIGELIKDRNIILKGGDAASAKGFTQVPNFLRSDGGRRGGPQGRYPSNTVDRAERKTRAKARSLKLSR